MKNARVAYREAIGHYRQWLLLIVCVIMSLGVMNVQAQAMEKREVTIEGSEDAPSVYEYFLYLGETKELPQREGTLVIRDEKVVVVEEGVAKAVGVGETELFYVTEEDGEQKLCTITVTQNPKFASITFKEGDVEALLVGGGNYQLTISAFQGRECTFTTNTPELASVTPNGTVTPLAEGLLIVHASVKDEYGWSYEYDIPIRLEKPKYSVQKTNLAKGETLSLTVQGTANKAVVAASTNGDVVAIVSVKGNVITIKGRKKGKATIIGTIGSVAFSCNVNVTDPKINATYGFYQKNKKFKLKLSGLNKDSKPVWASGDTSIATVDAKGTVKAKRKGSVVIACTVDGKVLVYYLAISGKTAVKAMRYGFKQVGKKKYSQARRMSKNYFDCSSFVYRCYKKAGKYLVAKTKWAPVAASIAKFYVKKGKRIKTSGKNYNLNKLLPGDLVCFGGKKAKKNGRYKRIYHIAMYIGNGLTMESSSTYNNVVIRDRGVLPKKGIPVIVRP